MLLAVDPLVGIVMGSQSDLEVMEGAAAVLDELSVPYELKVVSAHRTPAMMFDYARTARGRGMRVIVAGAGGAAHLPGMIASLTTLPVVGVPVPSKHLQGVDSLYSIVQMPAGVPVATVGIGNARNAGILAAKILGTYDSQITARLEFLMKDQEALVHRMNAEVERRT
jgi:5-(carboxyamino)imidazole ribonucleotide mutase